MFFFGFSCPGILHHFTYLYIILPYLAHESSKKGGAEPGAHCDRVGLARRCGPGCGQPHGQGLAARFAAQWNPLSISCCVLPLDLHFCLTCLSTSVVNPASLRSIGRTWATPGRRGRNWTAAASRQRLPAECRGSSPRVDSDF